MVGIQLYIETETIKRPFSPNWFKVYSDFALQFILLSVEKERHKILADSESTVISEKNIIISFLIILQTQKVYSNAFY